MAESPSSSAAGSPHHLLDDSDLESTSVVANNAMNRERGLRGENSYERELGFDPLERLSVLARADQQRDVAWLDLCCGRGRALIEAATLVDDDLRGQLRFVGVDLVDFFDPIEEAADVVQLVSSSVTTWQPDRRYELITSVHGLHYVGDKLAILQRAAGWLTPDGLLSVDFELESVRSSDGRSLSRHVARAMRQAGFDVNTRSHRLSLRGGRAVAFPLRYLGSDPNAGPNYTGQPAVHSYYETTA